MDHSDFSRIDARVARELLLEVQRSLRPGWWARVWSAFIIACAFTLAATVLLIAAWWLIENGRLIPTLIGAAVILAGLFVVSVPHLAEWGETKGLVR